MSAYTKFSDRFGKSDLHTPTPAKVAKPAKVTPISYIDAQQLDNSLATLATLARVRARKSIFEEGRASAPSAFSEATETLQPEDESLTDWEAGLARLDPARPPRDVPRKRWRQLIGDCARLRADGVFERAIDLGWTAIDLFGCDNSKPFSRIDVMGLAWLVTGWRVVMISEDAAILEASTGAKQTFRRRPGGPGRVLAWELTTSPQRMREPD